ncbi:hypothetical protein KDA_69130 [Dictyobacter alpinus]|uniref:Bacterial transcriptional activator domain-containing protein n=1 Tax=Dictyobacter alpinus TaxID=2014873 RepID=A0A402BJA7_9CHLR|nr:AAA family ATPase [Dictyobacter alpinus]GCE31429.1 hypothetical protein KDA_69130 [Dictyobacter alpinus]
MSRLYISVLGQPKIYHGDILLSFATRKALALLAYLTIEGGSHSRTQLSELFWPDSDAHHAHMSLRAIIRDLRSVLGTDNSTGQSHLLGDRTALGIDIQSDIEVDLYAFRSACSLATTISQSSIITRNHDEVQADLLAQLQQAARLYRGDILAGFTLSDAPDFDTWLRYQREQYHAHMHQVFEQLSVLYAASGLIERNLETLLTWRSLDPLHEAANSRLMQAHMAAGRRVAALRAYEDYRELLWQEQQVHPTASMISLAESIRLATSTLAQHTPVNMPGLSSSHQVTPPASMRLEGPLLGRTQEFNRLIEFYQLASEGRPQVVLIEGDAGIGKTRLVLEWLHWVQTQKASVLIGRAYKTGGHLPYQPIIELLRRHMEEENAPEDLLPDLWLAEVSRLLPELRERYPDLAPPVEDVTVAQAHLFEAIARLLQAWAQRSPLVLFIDDLQWADTSSFDLLHYMLRFWQEQQTAVCLILTQRNDESYLLSERQDWFEEVERFSPLARFSLQALTKEDVRDLLRQLVHYQPAPSSQFAGETDGKLEKVASWLFGYTSGQPFYLLETLNALADLEILKRPLTDGGGWRLDVSDACQHSDHLCHIVPSSVRVLLESRIRKLSSTGKELLVAVAVFGRGCTFEQLCQVAALADKDALQALDEVLNCGMLWVTGSVQGHFLYTFRHEIIRQAVYSSLSDARRQLLHRQILHILVVEQASAACLAYHSLEAGYHEQSFEYAVIAGTEACELYALQDAIGYFEQARRLLNACTDERCSVSFKSNRVQELYTYLGCCYQIRNELDRAQQIHEEMLTYARATKQATIECAALNCLAVLATRERFDLQAVKQLLLEAWQIAREHHDQIGQAESAWNLAQLSGYSRDLAAEGISGEQALYVARQLKRPEIIMRSIGGIMNTNARTRDWEDERIIVSPDEAAFYAEEAATLYAMLGNRVVEADCLCMLAESRIHAGRAGEAIELLRRAHALSVQEHDCWGHALSSCRLGWALQECGYYEEALQSCQEALPVARGLDISPLIFGCLAVMGAINLALLRPDEAFKNFMEACALNEHFTNQPYTEFLARKLCEVSMLKGDLADAYSYARQALRVRDDSTSVVGLTRWFETLALLQHHDYAVARDDAIEFGCRINDNRRYRLCYLHCLAILSHYEGKSTLALTYVHEALQLAEELNLPGEAWPLHILQSELYTYMQQPDAAQLSLDQAWRIQQELVTRVHDPVLKKDFQASLQNIAWPSHVQPDLRPIDQF